MERTIATVERISLSLPKELAIDLRTRAKKQRRTRSAVVTDLLLQAKRAEESCLMEEGYRYYAEELAQVAREAMPLAAEVWEPFADDKKAVKPQTGKRVPHAAKRSAARRDLLG